MNVLYRKLAGGVRSSLEIGVGLIGQRAACQQRYFTRNADPTTSVSALPQDCLHPPSNILMSVLFAITCTHGTCRGCRGLVGNAWS